jgi:hypothetical protein
MDEVQHRALGVGIARTSAMARILIALACAVVVAGMACSGNPTSPSATGATIAGTVIAAPSPMTVSIPGTALSSGVDGSGLFRLGGVPGGNVQLLFSGAGVASTITLANVADRDTIEIQVALGDGTATVLTEVRGNSQGKVVLCHRSESGYHAIDVSVNAEPAHRAHGDAKPGEPVPADPSKVFDPACALISPVGIEKFTNGQDVTQAPGPSIPIGSPVSWTYVITNRTASTFTSMTVTDDRGVAIACPQILPPPGASVTCTGSGVAVAGQYRNVGTVRVTVGGALYTDSDESFYFGGTAPEEEPKVQLCHRTGNGSYHSIEVGVSAEPAHRAHGDAKPGEPVPNSPGNVFTASCAVTQGPVPTPI